MEKIVAGRELDALVAEKVMGLKYWGSCCWGPDRRHITELPYSSDIAAAWEVLNHLGCNTKGLFYHDVYVQWQCVLDSQRRTFYDCRISVMADTAPLAICLAALKAMEGT